MRMRAGIILQARVASTRLPGKALAQIGGRPIVERCLRRLLAGGVAPVVLATTTNAEDDALEEIARQLGLDVYRGSEHDVLGRYAEAAQQFGFQAIIRATGDNPGVDIQAAGRVLAALRHGGADYAGEEGLPCGAGVEGISAAALARAACEATDPADREHVTTYIRRRPDVFRITTNAAPAPLRRPDVRLTVDTREDLAHVRTLFARTGKDEPSLRALIEVAGRPARGAVA